MDNKTKRTINILLPAIGLIIIIILAIAGWFTHQYIFQQENVNYHQVNTDNMSPLDKFIELERQQ